MKGNHHDSRMQSQIYGVLHDWSFHMKFNNLIWKNHEWKILFVIFTF